QADPGHAHPFGVVLLPVDLVVVVPIGSLADVAVGLGRLRQEAAYPLRVARPLPVRGRGDGRVAFGGPLHDLVGGVPGDVPADAVLVVDRDPHAAAAVVAARRHGV